MLRPDSRYTRRGFLIRLSSIVPAVVGLTFPAHGIAQDQPKLKIALDWYPNANHAGLFLAQERGYFERGGLDVDFYTPADPTTVLQTVGAGQDDFGISYQTDVLLAREQDVPVVAVAALVQHPLLCVMATEEQGITRPGDLVDKTVGYPGIPSQEAFLATMLAADGATLDDVNLVNVGFDLVPAAISGRANAVMGAYWTHETILAERQGHPVDILRVEDWGVPDYYELMLVASEETVAERPEVVTAFLGAVQRGYQDAIADQPAALDALDAAYPDIDREVETEGLALLAPEWTDGVDVYGMQTAERWTAFGDWMKEHDLVSDDLDVSKAYTTELLPVLEATPEATSSDQN